LVGAIVRQSWVTNSDAAAVVDLEQDGAAVLHPMTTLVSELVAARSAAVRGEPVNANSLNTALAAVGGLDPEYGGSLQMTQRLGDLKRQVVDAITRRPTGRDGFDTYSGLVTLAVNLEHTIGDTSHLVHDPDLDSYYVMDAAIVRLPDAMVYAGTASDLVALAGGATLSADDQTKAAVARYGVSAAAESVRDGLNKTIKYTNRAELGTNIESKLDSFTTAAARFAPPTMLQELAGPVDPEALAADANRVFAAANPLAHQLLSELQALLDVRAQTLAEQRRFIVVAAAAAVVLELLLIALVVTRRPIVVGRDTWGDGADVGTLAYARELLRADPARSDELVNVASTDRRRPGSDDAG
jgi:hypothetical protein